MGEKSLYPRTGRLVSPEPANQTTGTVFTKFISSLTNPGGEEELLLPLRQLLLKHITYFNISLKGGKVKGQLPSEAFSPGKGHRRPPRPPASLQKVMQQFLEKMMSELSAVIYWSSPGNGAAALTAAR